ncbi:hypothetical protein GCK72_004519 [Caenorhabditis remanei]|uniref:NR LBD domain-containing protein n=1 Tax=Caenorhabditis remanei TaxID=31234 RepID=A0A6A5H9T6_CAERE|nr:hypothetical protein GCK72_004519 [Caenorhabditis remanei]KAF1764570.1 hypothetical protein GCK72_004519 [Caenorhabditis remanei]
MQRNSLILPMMSYKLDIFEFFALATILLWNIGLENQTEECARTGEKMKEQVKAELVHYMKYYKRIEEPGIRIASIVNLLPAVERCVKKIQDDMEMTQVFKLSKVVYN